jgi:four helix bundle protein
VEHTFAFEKLEVWKAAKEFAISIYKVTRSFPAEERFGLVSQMNRAAVSVASNIAEGSARKGHKDKANFYQIAYSSLMEVTSQLLIAKDLELVRENTYTMLRQKIYEISNKLNALYNSHVMPLSTKRLNNSTTKRP